MVKGEGVMMTFCLVTKFQLVLCQCVFRFRASPDVKTGKRKCQGEG